jgi:hypothetical protein
VLFSDNEEFDKELQAAVREKRVAAWLYLNHLNNGDDASESSKTELITFARLVEYALSSSNNLRHKRLREEIRSLLKAERSRQRKGESGSSDE